MSFYEYNTARRFQAARVVVREGFDGRWNIKEPRWKGKNLDGRWNDLVIYKEPRCQGEFIFR